MGVFKRKNKDGTEGETWYVDYYDPTGKRVIKAVGPVKKEAVDYLGKIRASIREGRLFDVKKETRITFDEFLDDYIEKIREQKSFQKSNKYFISILREKFGKKLLSEIDYKMLEDFRDERKKGTTQYGTLRAERTVDIEMGIIRRILRKAVRWQKLEKNPFDYGEDLFFNKTNKREGHLKEVEVQRLIDACPRYLKPLVIAAIYTGLRKGDLLNLKWNNVDLEEGAIHLTEAKTGKARDIFLNSDMRTLLQDLPVRSEYVFVGRSGKPIRDIKRAFETAIKRAGIKQDTDRRRKIVFHSLRHSCVSLLTERGANTTMVKNFIGHSSEKMTSGYTHLSDEYARRTAEILNGLCRVNPTGGNTMETQSQSSNISPATA